MVGGRVHGHRLDHDTRGRRGDQAFGGFRLLTKLVLPGKVFDSEDRVEILQLGLTSKPVRTADFYSTPKT